MQSTRCRLPLPLLLLLGFLFLAVALPARADVGLPPAHPGYSISPGDFTTNVQMLAEEVLIDIQTDPDQAVVEAFFQMQNQSDMPEAFDVWFPLGEMLPYAKEDRIFKVDDFRAWVDETEATVTIEGLDEAGLIWAHWPVDFPATEPVELRVTYRLAPELGHSVGWHHRYEYILETGAGWLGAIEAARITVRTPFKLSEPNTLFQIGDPFFVKPLGYAVQGNEVVWTLYDLEPTNADNIDFYVFDPKIWASILVAYTDIEATGGSAESHWELAHGLSLWLQSFPHRPYEFTPSPPTAPDYEAATQWIIPSYVKSFEAGLLDTSHLSSFVFQLGTLRQYIDLPEIDGFFQAALSLRPEDVELQEAYRRAIEHGLADNLLPPTELPPTPTATSPSSPSPVPAAESTAPPSRPAAYLIIGAACLILAALGLLLATRAARR